MRAFVPRPELATAPRKAASAENAAAPPTVHEALRSPGRPLDAATRAFMERFGHDFSAVRVHSDSLAARSAEALDAAAYTVGSDIVFGRGRYAPGTPDGRQLLAHELAHVLEPGLGGALRRFHLPHGAHTTDETPLIASTYADMLAIIKTIITESSPNGETVDMDLFVLKCGGQPASAKIDEKLGTTSTQTATYELKPRYLFTCRGGLIDMRHFVQLLYISNWVSSAFPGASGNRAATRQGREHELLPRDPESRFGPEDTPTNALGAFTGSRLAGMPRPGDLYDTISETLQRCDPVDFKNLSASSQDVVRHYYGDLVTNPANPSESIPKNQNQSAVPAILALPECGGKERSFPYSLDTDDPDRKTISDTAFDKGATDLTSDSDIRDFVSVQRPEIIKALPAAEKVRLVKRLFSGWVSDADIDTIEVIYKNSSDQEKTQIAAAVNPDDLSDLGQRTRMRVLFAP